MNIHHLELFYYVARHGGITEAVRNIPYGIQQPAVSGQIAQLEDFLGVTLFQRRPFALTPSGQQLYQFITPFFSGLDAMTAELQGGATRQIRIGSSDIVLRDHLPQLLQAARRKYPNLRFSLTEGYQPELEAQLLGRELDLAITLTGQKPPRGLRSLVLLELPLILLVPQKSRISSADELWQRDRIADALICLPSNEAISRNFQLGLRARRVDWFPGIEVSSVDIIEAYVADGFGIGLTVSIPKTKLSPKVRPLPLPGFAPVVLGALWHGSPSPPLQTLLDELAARASLFRA